MNSEVHESNGNVIRFDGNCAVSVQAEEREPLSVYHDGSDGRTTSTRLRLFKRSPLIYAETHIFKRMPAEKPKSHFAIGTASHTLALEPERFAATVKLIPSYVLSKNGARGTNAYKQFAADHPGCQLLTKEEYDRVSWMAENVQRAMRDLFELPGVVEKTILWDDEASGLGCKCRPDKACGDDGILLDLKSMNDISRTGFERACCEYRYDDQSAFYGDGFEQEYKRTPDFLFVCYEKVPPYRARVYELDKADMQEGRQSNRAALVDLKRRTESGDWSEPDEGQIIPIKLSPWAKARREFQPTTEN